LTQLEQWRQRRQISVTEGMHVANVPTGGGVTTRLYVLHLHMIPAINTSERYIYMHWGASILH
jgi:hypothetical protein